MLFIAAIVALGLLATTPAMAKGKSDGTFPSKGEGAVHSNAPSTGTQMKGKERAMEVGKGKKKGLYKQKQPKTEQLESAPVKEKE